MVADGSASGEGEGELSGDERPPSPPRAPSAPLPHPAHPQPHHPPPHPAATASAAAAVFVRIYTILGIEKLLHDHFMCYFRTFTEFNPVGYCSA